MQLVVLKLALFDKLLVCDLFQVEAHKLLCKLFRNGDMEEQLETLVIETRMWCVLVEVSEKCCKWPICLAYVEQLLLSIELKIWICKSVVEVLDHLIPVAVLISKDLGRDVALGDA